MQKEKRKQSNDEEDDSSSRKRRKADLSKPVSFISTASMTEPESSRSRPRGGYDVFLSFRGEDTRKTITDHLYHALIQAGIHTFRDDNALPRGEEISPQLLKAIEGSRISVVVFSTNYASSRWCLDELVKIIECRQKIHQVVLPIFYDTDPSDVRKQTGSYAKAFDKHEEHFKGEMEKVNRWREALTQAANLSGYGLKNDTNGYEAEFIKRIVIDVACKLGNKTLHVAKHPVGISSRVRRVISLLTGARNNVGIVGIYGITGIGKTTIAKAVFNRLYSEFEGSSFLSGVKEISDKPNGLVKLQERLLHDILKSNVWKISNVDEGKNLIKERLHRKNILVVFDDVDKRELEALMGERCWFGDGSKIIVVTKNKHLLREVEVDGMYHAEELDLDDSLQLFSLHAFRETHPAKDYEELSEKVVDYCKGLPLALEILGSHLSIRDKAEWEYDIAQWQNIPHDDIQAKLRVSFDALDVDSREIFLDIACFFVGQDKDYVANIVDARYRCHPEVAFNTLIGRSLIRIDTENQNKLWMHDIVRKMGREIICRRSDNHPENYSRIVVPEDASTILSKEMGTEAVEGLALDVQGSFSTKSFKKMRRLKLLQITGAHLAGRYSLLPRELIWLCWLECPLKSLPSDFHQNELVILDMQGSKVRKLWKGTKILNKLKILNLSYSKYLVKTPNFQGLPSLERLILVECTSLVEVHRSIGNLKTLVLLNLEGCNSLKTLPESMGSLKSLQTLNVTRCSQLAKLPDSLGGLESLTLLNLEFCYSLKTLPESMGNLKSLQTLNITRCQLEKLPDSLGSLESLTLLNLELCYSLKTLPESMGSLKSLQTLNITRCSQLAKLPESLDGLESLTELFIKGTAIKQLPTSARYLKKLTNLSFGGYENVFCSPDPPSESRFSRFSSWLSPQSCSSSIAMRLDSFTSFTSLKKLDLSDAGLSDATSSIDFGSFSFLEDLDLSGNRFFNLPSGISRLPKIKHFSVKRCENLLSISEVPSNLASFFISRCKSIERVMFRNLAPPRKKRRIVYWNLIGCPNLIEVQNNNSSEDKDLRDEDLSEDEDLQDEDIRDYFKRSEIQETTSPLDINIELPLSNRVGNEIEFIHDMHVACEMHDANETIPRPEKVQNLKRGSSLQRPSTNQADEPQGVSSPPKNLSCLGLGSCYDQICSPSVKHDVIMDDVHNVVKKKTEPIASMLEQSNAIQVGLQSLEQGAEEELICLHPEAKSGMENTCAEYIQHVDRNDSLEQTRLMESTSERLVQPDTSASSTKLVGRASVKNAIWSCLMDDKVSIIGIYGMGGNGKTKMLKNICNELLERHGISHSIYWVNVPQDFRIDRSQDLIAERLYLNLSSKDDDRCSVVDLPKELMMKQKWILILNDLWNSFDPQELGIPIPMNGSKFIMTTRSKMVCQQMNCQNSIRVDPLSDEEAWTLFMENLGHDRQLSQEEKGIAEDAARKCGGLPLGIVTLAESLKGVHDLHKWKITLKRLKESNFWDMEDQIFKILRLSYDCLDDSAKQCFVYCALFDESHKIERGELIESFIEEGIIKEMSRPLAFDKGHSILDRLENVCLLERIDDGKAVKMHDLLRDMAIQILDDEYSLDMAKEERG